MTDHPDTTALPSLLVSGAPRGQAVLAGVLLHGRDRSREEKVILAESFGITRIRWLAPAADTGSWYPARFFEPRQANEPFLSRAIEQCDRVVDEATEDGRLAPHQIVLVGFSQGACLAVEYALQRPGRCGALIVFTGAVIGPPEMDCPSPQQSLKGTRILLTGSDADEWISEKQTRRTARILEESGAEVRLKIYHGRPHIVSTDELEEARTMLRELMPEPTRM